MITLREAAYAIYGAYRLARFDKTGFDYFDTTLRGFWNSFSAALFVAPFFVFLLIAEYTMGRPGESVFRFVAIEAIAYVIGWVLFPLVMIGIARTVGREERYLGYIVAYNWIMVIQNALYTPITIALAGTDAAMSSIGLIALAAFGYILVYTWFVTRSALDVAPPVAIMIVVVDIALSLILTGITQSMLSRPGGGV